MHAPYILSADDLGNFPGILWETSFLEAEDLSWEHAVEKL